VRDSSVHASRSHGVSVAYALTGWPGPDLKNHLSPVRCWPSAQNAFARFRDRGIIWRTEQVENNPENSAASPLRAIV